MSINALKKCILFKNFSDEHILAIYNGCTYTKKYYSKNETIAIEDTPCTVIGIVISGNIEIQKSFASGKIVVIDRLSSGNIFGEALIFSDFNTYPATIEATENNTEINFIEKLEIIKLCSMDIQILNNFMNLLSNKILMLNRKLKNLSYQSIRQKIACFILEVYRNKKSMFIDLSFSRREMADQLGIPRPSLSRELTNMKNEGLIDFDKNVIKILNIDLLENTLF